MARAFRSVHLGPLTDVEALGLLAGLGVLPEVAHRINRVAHGHPLALTMAATLQAGCLDSDIEDVALESVDQIAREYLAQVEDRTTREVLEASSVVRRATEPLVRAILPHVLPADALDRLRALPFVEVARDGLVVHDAVRDAIATALLSSAPERHRDYRVAAWRELRSELADAPPDANMWPADLLYLLAQPDVREGFFPTGHAPVAIEPARPEDEADFRAIVEQHDGPEGQRALLAWWEYSRQSVRIVRGREGETVGMSIYSPADELDRRVATRDPITAAWLQHFRRSAHDGERALFARAWRDLEVGDEPGSATSGASNLDLKRRYVEMRPTLRYIYVTARSLPMSAMEPLLFRGLPEANTKIDGHLYQPMLLDMGPDSVEGWLTRIIAKELGVGDESLAPFVDLEANELQLADRRVLLTPLEAGFAACLLGRPDRVVSRADLIERVWGYESDATSNVVDSLVRGLRRKLGPDASMIETVRGSGYRYRSASTVS